ncbi:MAG: CARDB domain-containing protein [Archaeoglobaceae archaeon]
MRLAIVSIVMIMACVVASAKVYVPTDYATIQQAIDNASEGEEIVVKSGIYEENLFINKSIVLKSEKGALSTIIKAKDQSLPTIKAESSFGSEISVKIIGFTIKGGSEGIRFAYTKDCEISESAIEENKVGIQLDAVRFCEVQKNRIANNNVGVKVEGSLEVRFWLNTFEKNAKDVVSQKSVIIWFSKEEIEYEYNGDRKGYLGNFWDENSCNDWNRDGVCDDPYSMTSSDTDMYPLVAPYGVDLAIKALEFEKIVVGEDNKIRVTISNLGGYIKAKSVLVSLYVTDQNKTTIVGKKMIRELPSQSEAVVEFNWRPYVVRNYALKAVAESPSVEFNFDNNELVVPIDFQIPDLALINVSVPDKIFINESCEVAVKIANTGNTRAENFSVSLYLRQYGEELISSKRVSLNAKESTTVYLPWTPTESGSLSLKVVLDPENEVTELNEKNNQMTLRVTVEEGAKPEKSPGLEGTKTPQQITTQKSARSDTNVFLVIAVAFIALGVVSFYLAKRR